MWCNVTAIDPRMIAGPKISRINRLESDYNIFSDLKGDAWSWLLNIGEQFQQRNRNYRRIDNLELRSTIEVKILLNGFNNRLKKAEKKVDELGRSMKICKSKEWIKIQKMNRALAEREERDTDSVLSKKICKEILAKKLSQLEIEEVQWTPTMINTGKITFRYILIKAAEHQRWKENINAAKGEKTHITTEELKYQWRMT